MASFKNCKYQWQLQVTLKEYFDSLSLQTPEDFDKVADTILAAIDDYQSLEKKKRTPHIDKLSAKLQVDVQNILNYLDAPNENISPQFVNENLHLFGLSAAISAEETFAAYQELAKDILNEIAIDFKKLTQKNRNDIIVQKNAQLEQKQEEQAKLKAKTAPTPESVNSTHQLFLTKMVGGADKFNEVFVKLKAQPVISECRSPVGNLEGVLTDEDGLRWSFEIKADDDQKFIILVKNYDALHLSVSEPSKVILANELTMIAVLPANTFPKGHFQYQSSITKDLLLSRIQELAYVAFCVAFGKMNNIHEQSLSRKIDELTQSREYPPRAQMKELILGLVQPPPPIEFIGGLLAGILQAMNNHQGQGEEESSDEFDGPGMIAFPQAMLPGLRAFLLRNGPAEDGEDQVDNQVELEVVAPVESQAVQPQPNPPVTPGSAVPATPTAGVPRLPQRRDDSTVKRRRV